MSVCISIMLLLFPSNMKKFVENGLKTFYSQMWELTRSHFQ